MQDILKDMHYINKELCEFLDASPNSFFAVANIAQILEKHGFRALTEGQRWELEPGKGYYVTRNGSALIAFILPEVDFNGYQIYACHSDSPAFKLKSNAEIIVEKKYLKLNAEKYGGMIMSTWLDRPLSLAGRVLVNANGRVEAKLVNLVEETIAIPSLAIHMERNTNEGHKWNAQVDMLPLAGGANMQGQLLQRLAASVKVKPEAILDMDLYLYNKMPAVMSGLDKEFIMSSRLDDLQCAYAGLKGFLQAEPKSSVPVYCLLDNEEVGSGTRQGAASTFLKDTLKRIHKCLHKSEEEYLIALANSLMLSADNAHAVHPNHTDKADPSNKPYLNEGIVIKYSANQKYTTDAVSGALFRMICQKAGVPYQVFANRSDMLGGSTLGNISTNQVAVKTVDIGLPQLAMHSAYETAGAKDTLYLVEAAKEFFSSSIIESSDGSFLCL